MFPLFFSGLTDATTDASPPLQLYNTLSRKKERFVPLHNDYVRMYNCGPTVYDFAHLGNLRSYVFADTIRRVLLLNGYKVMQVVNITDVGHLTSDADEGDDKMTIALKRENKPLTVDAMREVAETYTVAFLEDLSALNIRKPSALPRASEHIQADIALISTLVQKEYAYETSDGVYFDTGRFPEYGKLGNVSIDSQREGARVTANVEKRNPSDFALWKKNPNLGWGSPWGKGFPGWHIECSAMAMEYLGKEIDIHTGGIDHIGTHHNNEIAQSEAATGRQFSKVWMHNAHILIEGTKFSKSLGNTIQLRQLVDHGFSPLAYRYWLLTGHYRTPMSFSFTALDAAQTALKRLHRFFVEELPHQNGIVDKTYSLRFLEALNDDLDTPKAIATIWDLIKDSSVTATDKRATLLHIDKALGLGLNEIVQNGKTQVPLEVASADLTELPDEVRAMVLERESARNEKKWSHADELRAGVLSHGYEILDTPEGPKVRKTL